MQSEEADRTRRLVALLEERASAPGADRGALLEVVELARAVERDQAHLHSTLERHQDVLRRAAGIVGGQDAESTGRQILDTLLVLLRAERGFVALQDEGGLRFLAARNMERRDLDRPEQEVSTGIIDRAVAAGEPLILADASTDGLGSLHSVQTLRLRSVACMPITLDAEHRGVIYLDNREQPGVFDSTASVILDSFLPIAADALRRSLEDSARPALQVRGVVTRSPAFREVLEKLARVAPLDASILLVGETGTGKSLIARQLHAMSPRADAPFVHLNCGALPESLVDAELFGAERGAYTGADQLRQGKFEQAQGGTLFLDELQALPAASQVKLLVALQERTVTRLGGSRPLDIDVRLIAAMNLPPAQAVNDGVLRKDLYYRLAVIVAQLPPLRDRVDDIPWLAEHILSGLSARLGGERLRVEPEVIESLQAHPWPGNVRELQNTLERGALLSHDGIIREIDLDELPEEAEAVEQGDGTTAAGAGRRDRVEREEFLRVWDQHDGHIGQVAEALGVHRKSIWRIRKRLGLA